MKRTNYKYSRLFATIISIMMFIPLVANLSAVNVEAFALNNISVSNIEFYESGCLKGFSLSYTVGGTNLAPAKARISVQTQKFNDGDFTDVGNYADSHNYPAWPDTPADCGFVTWNAGGTYDRVGSGKSQTVSVTFNDGVVDCKTEGSAYYVYLWANYGGDTYPDAYITSFTAGSGDFDVYGGCEHENVTHHTEIKEATCTENGVIQEYYECNDCNNAFSDESCTTHLKKSEVMIGKLGHDFEYNTDEVNKISAVCKRDGCGLEVSYSIKADDQGGEPGTQYDIAANLTLTDNGWTENIASVSAVNYRNADLSYDSTTPPAAVGEYTAYVTTKGYEISDDFEITNYIYIDEVDVTVSSDVLKKFYIRGYVSPKITITDSSANYVADGAPYYTVVNENGEESLMENKMFIRGNEYYIVLKLKTDENSLYRFASEEEMTNSRSERYSFDDNGDTSETTMLVKYYLGYPSNPPSDNSSDSGSGTDSETPDDPLPDSALPKGDEMNSTITEDNVGEADIEIPEKTTIEDIIVLTAEDKKAIKNGEDIVIYLEVDNADETVSDDDKKKTEEVISEGMNIGMYLDVNLFKKVGNRNPQKITETVDDIWITIRIPDELLLHKEGITRVYNIVRVHNNKAEIIDGIFDERKNEFRFRTDKFSSYAIIYTDYESDSGDLSAGENIKIEETVLL